MQSFRIPDCLETQLGNKQMCLPWLHKQIASKQTEPAAGASSCCTLILFMSMLRCSSAMHLLCLLLSTACWLLNLEVQVVLLLLLLLHTIISQNNV
jgi:hypothetical protein